MAWGGSVPDFANSLGMTGNPNSGWFGQNGGGWGYLYPSPQAPQQPQEQSQPWTPWVNTPAGPGAAPGPFNAPPSWATPGGLGAQGGGPTQPSPTSPLFNASQGMGGLSSWGTLTPNTSGIQGITQQQLQGMFGGGAPTQQQWDQGGYNNQFGQTAPSAGAWNSFMQAAPSGVPGTVGSK